MKFKTTAELRVDKSTVNQIIGQDEAVEVIKKAAKQRRHVLLIGKPGTGKSMLGQALAELLPTQKLSDILVLPNLKNENQPLVKTVSSGRGKALLENARSKNQSRAQGKTIIFFILTIIAMILPWWIRSQYGDIMAAASLLAGMIFVFAFAISIGMNVRKGLSLGIKLLVDSSDYQKAPFIDATGAHSGALLGDVRHDPFQTFSGDGKIKAISANGITEKKLGEIIDKLFLKYDTEIIKNQEKNYEALHLPENELKILGESEDFIAPVKVLSVNRYNYNSKLVKITMPEGQELLVTPEHKIAVLKKGSIIYKEAQSLAKGERVVTAPDLVITKQDIINTFDERQQEQCKLYFQYLRIKRENPKWGYKKIAKLMNQPAGKTRWWHSGKHVPKPIQTIERLKLLDLLPLSIDNPKLLLAAKILGATFGDGGIFGNLNGIFLSSSELEATKEFGQDLEKLFGKEIGKHSRIIEGGEYGHSWCYQNTNRDVIRLFKALGAPIGKKSEVDFKVPGWVKLLPNLEKEFYGAFLGSELGTPSIHKRGNYLTSLEIGITGRSDRRENRLAFLNEVSTYLKKNKVNTTSIYEGKKDDSLVFRLLIEKKLDNVIPFLTNIKINYCKYKVDRLYDAVGKWAVGKKEKFEELVRRGYGAERAMKVLNLTPSSLYMVLNDLVDISDPATVVRSWTGKMKNES